MGMGGVWTFRHWSQEIHSATCVISGSSFHHSRKRISFDVPGRKQLTCCPTIHGCSCTDGGRLIQVHCPWKLRIPSRKQDGSRMSHVYTISSHLSHRVHGVANNYVMELWKANLPLKIGVFLYAVYNFSWWLKITKTSEQRETATCVGVVRIFWVWLNPFRLIDFCRFFWLWSGHNGYSRVLQDNNHLVYMPVVCLWTYRVPSYMWQLFL
jgi:hypothetical protein